jgi:hypothetical protein
MVLSFTIAAGPRQCSHSQVRVPRNSWPHFTVSDSGLPQPGGPGSRIYIPQEQSGQVIPPGTAFAFHRLLRLAGLRWRYSTPPSHGIHRLPSCWSPLYSLGTDCTENTASRGPSHIAETCLPCQATAVSSSSAFPTFMRHVTDHWSLLTAVRLSSL